MDAPTPIVLVTGPPASGKTFVAELVADRLGLPLIAKDAIKETLFRTLGTSDVAWSQRLGRATFALVQWALEAQLEAGKPVVVEGNFAAEDALPALRALAERCRFEVLELHCTAPDDVLLARFAARAGLRHPGHHDLERMQEIASAISAGRYGALRLGGLMLVDTSSFDDIDEAALLRAAEQHVRGDG